MPTKQAEAPVAVVTGVSGGIGQVLARSLLASGNHVLAVSRNLEPLQHFGRYAVPGREFVALAADVSSTQGRSAVAEAIRTRFGYLTCLVNNAATGMSSIRADYHERPVRPADLSEETLQRFLMVNAHAPIALTLLLLPLFNQGWGRIVNIGTSFNAMHRPGFLPYGMSKAAFESASAILAKELADSGITVNVVNPGGPIATPMTTGSRPSSRKDLISPDIMAAPVAWLASRAADGFSGQRITATRWTGDAKGDAVAPIGWPQLAADSTWQPARET